MIQPLFILSDFTFLILRIVFGIIAARSGISVIKASNGTDANNFAKVLGAASVAFGMCVVFGFLTQLFAFLSAVLFVVSFFIKYPLDTPKLQFVKTGSADFIILFFAAALVIMSVGGGALTADKFFRIFLY